MSRDGLSTLVLRPIELHRNRCFFFFFYIQYYYVIFFFFRRAENIKLKIVDDTLNVNL